MPKCCENGCSNWAIGSSLYCAGHITHDRIAVAKTLTKQHEDKVSLATLYPKYYKAIPAGTTAVDTYVINQLFPVNDPSGAIVHARKKLLIPGVRSGGKSMRKDIQEARDTLNRWLELNPE